VPLVIAAGELRTNKKGGRCPHRRPSCCL
jgi:hypothetical protein